MTDGVEEELGVVEVDAEDGPGRPRWRRQSPRTPLQQVRLHTPIPGFLPLSLMMESDHSIVGLMSLVFPLRRDPLFEPLVVFFLSHTQLIPFKLFLEALLHKLSPELFK